MEMVPLAPSELPTKAKRDVRKPLPERSTICGLLVALSVMMTEPKTDPPRVGAKETLTMQLLPAAMLDPQVLVWVKSALWTMLLTETAELELLFTVTSLAALV